jgi:hypothetical protein
MLSVRACKTLIPALAITGALIITPAFATRTHRAATSGHTNKAKKKSTSSSHTKVHGQRQIDPERAREIQSALIREHYLSGTPSGEWDAESQAAMTRFQADQGWQTKLTPDSRALIKLGLGPNQDAAKVPPGGQAFMAPSPAGSGQSSISSGNALATAPGTLAQ